MYVFDTLGCHKTPHAPNQSGAIYIAKAKKVNFNGNNPPTKRIELSPTSTRVKNIGMHTHKCVHNLSYNWCSIPVVYSKYHYH